MRISLLCLGLGVLAMMPAQAARPEIDRPVGEAQGNGVRHALRVIPEACARLDGQFTGDPANPYRFGAVRTGGACRPRARLVNADTVKPSEATGWTLNDVIRIPAKNCPGLQAVATVWRKQGSVKPPALDAQGRARIYLQDARKNVPALDAVPAYAATLSLDGRPCA